GRRAARGTSADTPSCPPRRWPDGVRGAPRAACGREARARPHPLSARGVGGAAPLTRSGAHELARARVECLAGARDALAVERAERCEGLAALRSPPLVHRAHPVRQLLRRARHVVERDADARLLDLLDLDDLELFVALPPQEQVPGPLEGPAVARRRSTIRRGA